MREYRRCGGLDIPLAPPVMLLRSKNFFRNSLRSAAPPTPEQADSAFSKLLGFSSGRTQNPPVLWLTESACSRPEQSLSATHGRQRYNTLDFARKVVCHETAGFIGFFLPLKGAALLWIPPAKAAPPPLGTTAKGTLSPLESSANRALPAPTGLPKAKGTAIPLESQMRFGMCTHKEKMNCGHSFQNAPLGRSSAMVISRGFAAIR